MSVRHSVAFALLAGGAFLLPPQEASGQESGVLMHTPVSTGEARAQPASALRLVPSLADGSVRVEFDNLLGSVALRQSLEGGLPVRIRLVVELWRDRFFDEQAGRIEWRATVRHDPLTESFRVEAEDGLLRYTDSLDEAGALLESWVDVPLTPRTDGRYYYLGRVEIETLSLSDLEELRRWLQGDLAPAMDEGEPVGSAVGRGVRRLVVRVLGLPTQKHEARSPAFDWNR